MEGTLWDVPQTVVAALAIANVPPQWEEKLIGRALKLETSWDFKISGDLSIPKFAHRCTVALHSRDECQGSCIDLCAIG